MTIGERLTNERKKLGLTQEDLGAKLNISRQAISKWESDISLPDAANLIKLSSLFSCSIDYILNGTERERKKKRLEQRMVLRNLLDLGSRKSIARRH